MPADRAEGEALHALLDGLLAREEDEDVPFALLGDDARHDLLDLGLHGVASAPRKSGCAPSRDGRVVDEGDREHRRLDLDDRALAEVLGEDLGVDRRRGDDDLELGPRLEDALEEPEDEVDVEAPLVGLVDHDDAVAREGRVELHLLEEDPVGHDLDGRRVARLVLEAHLVADEARDLDAELPRDEVGDREGGDAPRAG